MNTVNVLPWQSGAEIKIDTCTGKTKLDCELVVLFSFAQTQF